jgi:hypothetical protein
VIPAKEIPVGTVIPVMLSSSLNAAKDKPENKLEGRVIAGNGGVVGCKKDPDLLIVAGPEQTVRLQPP